MTNFSEALFDLSNLQDNLGRAKISYLQEETRAKCLEQQREELDQAIRHAADDSSRLERNTVAEKIELLATATASNLEADKLIIDSLADLTTTVQQEEAGLVKDRSEHEAKLLALSTKFHKDVEIWAKFVHFESWNQLRMLEKRGAEIKKRGEEAQEAKKLRMVVSKELDVNISHTNSLLLESSSLIGEKKCEATALKKALEELSSRRMTNAARSAVAKPVASLDVATATKRAPAGRDSFANRSGESESVLKFPKVDLASLLKKPRISAPSTATPATMPYMPAAMTTSPAAKTALPAVTPAAMTSKPATMTATHAALAATPAARAATPVDQIGLRPVFGVLPALGRLTLQGADPNKNSPHQGQQHRSQVTHSPTQGENMMAPAECEELKDISSFDISVASFSGDQSTSERSDQASPFMIQTRHRPDAGGDLFHLFGTGASSQDESGEKMEEDGFILNGNIGGGDVIGNFGGFHF